MTRRKVKKDGWANVFTGQGLTGKDKQLGTSFGTPTSLTEQCVNDLYRGEGFGKRVITLPTGQMVREWFNVLGDTDGDIIKYQEKLRLKQFTLQALQWAHVFGGSVIVMGIDDGGDLETPLNEGNIKSVDFLRVYDRYRITWNTAELYEDAEHPKYGTPELYTINPITYGNVSEMKVHETRMLLFDGVSVSDKIRQENNGWGDSIYQAIYTELANLAGSYFAAKNVIDDFIQIILKIDNLQELLAAGKENLIKQRLQIIDLGRHMMNTIMIDSKEDYEKSSSSVAGIADIMKEFQKAVSAVTEIPMTLLMGQSPDGMNATGASDISQWYDKIAEDQETEMLPQMERITKIISLAKDSNFTPKKDEELSIEFNPLWQQTEKEITETRKNQAETDKMYIEHGVLDASEVAVSRFGGDTYSLDTQITPRTAVAPDTDPVVPVVPNMDDFDTILLKDNTSWFGHHFHPYKIDKKGNGKAKSGKIFYWPGGEEFFTLKHDHEIIEFRVQAGGTDGHTHDLAYDLDE